MYNTLLKERRSIRAGSFFENSKLLLVQWLFIIFLWSIEESSNKVSLLTGLSLRTVITSLQKLRDICSLKIQHGEIKLGGQGKTVEIHESMFGQKREGAFLEACGQESCLPSTKPYQRNSSNRTCTTLCNTWNHDYFWHFFPLLQPQQTTWATSTSWSTTRRTLSILLHEPTRTLSRESGVRWRESWGWWSEPPEASFRPILTSSTGEKSTRVNTSGTC